MSTRLRLFLILMGGLLVVATYTFPLWQPLFVSNIAEDPFEIALRSLPTDQQAALRALANQNPDMAGTLAASVGTVTQVSHEDQALPEMVDPVIVASASFVHIDALHSAEGTATIYQIPEDNRRVLRFEDFRSTNCPELEVLLSTAEDPRSPDDLGEDTVQLGQLQGNVGNQNYDIPAETDLSLYNSVVIYCPSLQMVFSTATLTTP